MKHIAFLALALLTFVSTQAATVTGTFIDNSGSALSSAIVRFKPTSNPAVLNTNISGGIQKSVTLSTNGTYSTTLVQGNYTVTCNGYAFNISVPAGSGTYDQTDLATGVNNFPFTGLVKVSSDDTEPEYLSDKLIAGSGVSLTVTNAGGDEAIIITATGGGGASLSYDFAEDFDAVGDGTTDNTAAWATAMAGMADGDTLYISDGTYILDSVNVTKDINIIGLEGGTLKHKASATGHMLKWTVEGNGEIRGVTFDANVSNNGTNTTYAVLYPWGGKSQGLTIENCRFVGFMKAAILDEKTTGELTVRDNHFVNGYKVPLASTNTAIVNSAIWFAPGIANNRPKLIVDNNTFTNSAPSASERLPGGVAIFGAESVGHLNYAEITFNHFAYVGGDTDAGSWHVGTAAVDWYRHTQGIMGWNTGTNLMYIFGKIDQSADVQVVGNHGHTQGNVLYKYAPGERDQTNEFRFGVFKDNWAYPGTNDTLALYLSAGLSGGLRETIVDGFYAPGFTRVIQLEGFTDDDGSLDAVGPFIIRNVHGSASNYGLWGRGIQGPLTIEHWYVAGTGSGSSILINQTNTAAKVYVKNSHPTAENGYAGLIRGVAVASIESSSFTETGSGIALDLSQDADGNNINRLYFARDNTVSGTVNVVTADIDAGYYWSGNTVTRYPSGATETLGDGTTTYLDDWRFDYAGPVLGRRGRNLSPGGAWSLTWSAESATGSIWVHDDTYSDADRADRFVLRAESDSGGIDIWSVAGTIRAKAGNVLSGTWTTTNYAQVGNITAGGSVSSGDGGSAAGVLTLGEGTAPSLTANKFSIYAGSDVAAGGLAYVLPTAAASGIMRAADSSGVMTITHDGGFSHLAGTASDAQIPNNITIDLATLATTATTANSVANNSVTGAGIALASQAAGDIMYYDGTDWVRLPKGTAEQVLKMNGGATAPEWGDRGGTAGITGSGSTTNNDDFVTLYTYTFPSTNQSGQLNAMVLGAGPTNVYGFNVAAVVKNISGTATIVGTNNTYIIPNAGTNITAYWDVSTSNAVLKVRGYQNENVNWVATNILVNLVTNGIAAVDTFSPDDISDLKVWLAQSSMKESDNSDPEDGDTVKWNDISGNGWHISNDTGSRWPTYDSKSWGGAARFNGAHWLTNAAFSQAQPNTVFMVATYARAETTAAHTWNILYGNAPSGGAGEIYRNNVSGSDTTGNLISAGTASSVMQVTHQTPHVYTAAFNTTASFMRVDGVVQGSGMNINTGTKDDLTIGAFTDGTFPSYALVAEVIVYNRLLNTNEIQQVESYLYEKIRTGRPNVVFDGDSHTRGYTAATHWGDYPYQAVRGLDSSVTWANRGIPSQTSAQMLSTVSDVDALISTNGSINILVVSIGANDLATGVSLATLQGNLQSYITGRRAAGYDVIITVGIPPHNTASNYTEANWNSYNDWLDVIANTGADANVDIRSNLNIGEWGDNTNATYYGADNVHMKDAGNLELANLVITAINSYTP